MRTFVATTVKSKRWFSLESKTSGKRMPQLSKSEVREDMEGNHRAEDNLEAMRVGKGGYK